MLAMRERDNTVQASVPGLADAARITLEQCEEGLKELAEADPYSRNADWEGRRIEACHGGWRLLNAETYRQKLSQDDRREYQKQWQRDYRLRMKEQRAVDRNVENRGQTLTPFTQSESESKTLTKTKTRTSGAPAKSSPAWNAYAEAYERRYQVKPVRNSSVNSMLCRLVDKLGANAIPVSMFYVEHNAPWYLTKGHAIQCLLNDAEKLHTEWQTGRSITTKGAKEPEKNNEPQAQVDRIMKTTGKSTTSEPNHVN